MADPRDFPMISPREWARIEKESLPPYLLQMGVGSVLGASIVGLVRGEQTKPLDVVLGGIAGAALGAADRYLRERDIRHGSLNRPTMRVILGVLLIAAAVTEYIDSPLRRVGMAVLGGLLIASGIAATGDAVPETRWLLNHKRLELSRERARRVAAQAAGIEDRMAGRRVTREESVELLDGDGERLLVLR